MRRDYFYVQKTLTYGAKGVEVHSASWR